MRGRRIIIAGLSAPAAAAVAFYLLWLTWVVFASAEPSAVLADRECDNRPLPIVAGLGRGLRCRLRARACCRVAIARSVPSRRLVVLAGVPCGRVCCGRHVLLHPARDGGATRACSDHGPPLGSRMHRLASLRLRRGLANKPLERSGMNASRRSDRACAGRSAPVRSAHERAG